MIQFLCFVFVFLLHFICNCFAFLSDVLVEGGNAVDAAIAAMFCTGTVHPHTSGIGGGVFMTIYDPATKTGWSLDSREVAPLAATANMFNGNSSLSQKGSPFFFFFY